MTTNEGQPSGQNPEWEVDKEQNIAIAKRIGSLLLSYPATISDLMPIGHTRNAGHVDNSYRRIFLGVGYNEKASRDEKGKRL